MYKLCVFAGTSEARQLIWRLAGRGVSITACVATEYGEVTLGEQENVRVLAGRMPVQEIAAMLEREGFDVVVDATHPYAASITESIRTACEQTHTRRIRLLRDSTAREEDGVFLPDTEACVRYLQGTFGNILLTTGSKTLPLFCADGEMRRRVYARVLPMEESLGICRDCGLGPDRILAMQGPFSEEMNYAMLCSVKAAWMVTKDTGDAGGYAAKIRAARRAGTRVLIIGRPAQEFGETLEETISQLEKCFALPPLKKQVTLVGIGMGSADTRTLGVERAVKNADCLIGARRMLESVDTAGKETYAAVDPCRVGDYIRKSGGRRFAVLLSGDTGFYSGARKLRKELEDMDVELLPGIGSLSYLCSRLGRPWEDVRAVSLHGRSCDLVREVKNNPAVFSLLGGDTGPAEALELLRRAGLGALPACIGEDLGYPEEALHKGTVEELSRKTYGSLCVLLVENTGYSETVVTHGLPDEAFDRDEVPMTKSEVRSISLSKLMLTREAVVYDIGAGSGSVAVECAIQAEKGKVYAVERKNTAVGLIRRNAEKFALANLEVVPGLAPQVLAELPAPTHAFIGGSAGNLREIVDCLLEKNSCVRIVANAVTLETAAELTGISKDFAFCDIAQVSVAKPRKLGSYHLMTAQNPVYIFTMQNDREER